MWILIGVPFVVWGCMVNGVRCLFLWLFGYLLCEFATLALGVVWLLLLWLPGCAFAFLVILSVYCCMIFCLIALFNILVWLDLLLCCLCFEVLVFCLYVVFVLWWVWRFVLL